VIIDTVNNSIQSIEEFKKAKNRQINNATLLQNLTQLSNVLATLETSIGVIDAVEKNNLHQSVWIDEEIRHVLINGIEDCGNEVDNFALSNDKVVILKNYVEMLSRVIKDEWGRCSESFAGPTLQLLTILENLTENPEEAKEIKGKITSYHVIRPKSKKDVEAYMTYVKRGQVIVNSLDVNDHITLFLSKVSRGTATVVDLNPEIMQWLSNKKLQNKIRVRF
jgi:hypothetical protein